jgi:hypothetical protein
MSFFEALLFAGLVVVTLLSWRCPRALAWLAAGTANYVITSAYFAYGLPAHPFFTLLIDALVCFALIVKWEYRWEAALCWIFGVSVSIDLARLSLLIDGHAYATGLELVNWAALLTIGGPRLIELADAWLDHAGYRNRYFHSAHRLFSAPRSPPSQWHA